MLQLGSRPTGKIVGIRAPIVNDNTTYPANGVVGVTMLAYLRDDQRQNYPPGKM